VAPPAFHPGAADDEARAAIGGLGGQRFDPLRAGLDEGGLEDEVLGRVAGDGEFGGDDQVGAGGGGSARAARMRSALRSSAPSCGLICARAMRSGFVMVLRS
jgi:hypothetical protein